MINKLYANKIINTVLILSLLFFGLNLEAQEMKANADSLKKMVFTLASDSLKGRFPGTFEDSLTAAYIAGKLSQAGLIPLIGDSYLIPFEITLYREVCENSSVKIGGRELIAGEEFAVNPLSPEALVKGEVADATNMGMAQEKIAFLKISRDSVVFKVTGLKERGFEALLFYDSTSSNISFGKLNGAGFPIPVLSVSPGVASELIEKSGTTITISTNTRVVKAKTYNVAGITPGENRNFILAGAHYDHLGFGGTGSGSVRSGEDKIHPGADDNASGVSSVLEVARLLTVNQFGDKSEKRFAVAAFGAEERGLIGSAILADTLMKLGRLPGLMINLDMVGRLRDSKLQAGGVGTFEEADSLLAAINSNFGFDLVSTKTGSGPSDHSSFNSKKIPVLYFTTGVHSEYHTPADSAALVNINGLAKVTDFIATLITHSVTPSFNPKYIQLEESSMPSRNSFKVTLGIIPDFTYDKGDGFRIGPVSDGRPAQKAGLLEGDIIVEMGGRKIANIYDYMSALGQIKKGEIVEVCFIRDGSQKNVKIEL
ncbi:MAG: M28 family peptidase [Bacteroidia bacterium]|nr:M28 family peptidase [Bacteroidia bacterium]